MDAKKLFLTKLSNNDYVNGFDLYNHDIVDFLSLSEHHNVCIHLYNYCSDLINQLNLEDDEEINDENISNYELILKQLKTIVQIVTVYTDLPQYRFMELLNTVQLLHDILIPLNNELQGSTSLKTAIARICEHWWKKNENGAENLIIQLIPYLILCSIGPDAIDADVKRLFQIREAMNLFDFEDPSIETIRHLILRCFMHPAFLRNVEGQKFLSFVFSLSPALHPYILEVMKPQLVTGMKFIASSYGEILYRAWKDSKGDDEITNNQKYMEELLQVIVHEAIHASDSKYGRSLRNLMKCFHDHKRLKDVDSMLLRIYGPILWRSLRCANAIVRAQASNLFFDAFPLQDSEGTAADVDIILQKQFDLLTSLLKDDDHRVRATAASGVCHILTEYWEALPGATTKQILSFIVGTLGFDASSAQVRLAVLTGLNELLEQPLSHNILKNLLPVLSNAIHDKSEKNRIEFIKILTKVKRLHNMHFYKIVSVENLLLRLADDEDKPVVCRGMTALLINSFYPQGSGPSFDIAKVSRSLNLIRQNLPAAEAFYGHLVYHSDVSVGSVAKFSWLLFSLFLAEKKQLEAMVEADLEQNKEDYEGEAELKTKRGRAKGKVNEDDFDLVTSILTDSQLQSGILKVILSCLMSIKSKLKEGSSEESKAFIEGKFNEKNISNVLKRLSSIEDDGSSDAIPTFMRIISILVDLKLDKGQSFNPISYDVVEQELNDIMSNPDKVNYQSQMIASIELLCTLNKADILIDKVKKSFKAFIKSNNKSDHISDLKGGVEILSVLIETENVAISTTRDEIISKEEEVFTGLFNLAKDVVIAALTSNKFIDARETFARCSYLWASYSIRKTYASKLSDDSGLSNVEEIESVGKWVTENIFPIICSFDASDYKKKLSQQVLSSIMLVFTDALLLEVGESVIIETYIEWMRTLEIYSTHSQEQGHAEYPLRYLIPMVARTSYLISTRDKLLSSCGDMKVFLFNILNDHCDLLISNVNDSETADDTSFAASKYAAAKAIIANLKLSSTSTWDPLAIFMNNIIQNMIKFDEFKTTTAKFSYELLKQCPETIRNKCISYTTAYISYILGATNGSNKLYNGFKQVTVENQNQLLKGLCQMLYQLSKEGSDKHIDHSRLLITKMFETLSNDPQCDKENYDITRSFEMLRAI